MIKSIGEITKVGAGQSAPQDAEAFSNSGTPFVRAGSLEFLCKGASLNRLERINEQQAKIHKLKLYPSGTILFAKSGMSAVQNRVFVLPKPAHVVSHLATIEVKSGVDSKFLSYFWQNFKTSNLIQDPAYPSISLEAVGNVEIELPNSDEQKRIAAILDKADRLRRQRRFAQTLSDSFLQSVFIKMFGDPVSNPMNWTQVIFGKEIKLKSGDFLNAASMDERGKHPVYGGNGINGYHSSFLFEERKIVIGRVGAYCGVVHYSKPFSWITDNALYVVRKSSELSDLFLVYLLHYLDLNQYSGQSGQPLISEGRLENINLIAPPLPFQEKFAEIVQKFERVRRQQREATRHATHLFQTLLHRAFRGKL